MVTRVLEVRDLTKRYGTNLAVDGLSFRAEPGRVLGFLGPNGAGKTTTLRMLLGLTLPTSGETAVDGVPYRTAEGSDQGRRGGAGGAAVPSRPHRAQPPARAGHGRGPAGARVTEVLRLVELDGAGGKRVKAYSLGMRQRLSLAGALLGDPRALVLDEPANGLDPQGIRWLRDFLRGQAAEGRTVLVSSHVLAEMAQTVDEVVVISHGRLVAQGSLEELTAGAEAPVWVRSPEPERLQVALAAQDGVARRAGETPGGWLAVRGASLETVGTTAAENGIAVFELYRPRQSLESVFLELTGGDRGRLVTRVVAAELLKLRTTRTFWGLALSALGLVLVIVVLNLALDDDLASPSDVRGLLSTRGHLRPADRSCSASWQAAGEYRHGTIASTLLVTPQRLRAVSAAVIACCLGGLAIGRRRRPALTAAIAHPVAEREGRGPALRSATTCRPFLGGDHATPRWRRTRRGLRLAAP